MAKHKANAEWVDCRSWTVPVIFETNRTPDPQSLKIYITLWKLNPFNCAIVYYILFCIYYRTIYIYSISVMFFIYFLLLEEGDVCVLSLQREHAKPF